MNANERRLICCEALSHYHETLTDEPINSDDYRDKCNDVAKSFAKIQKILVKNKVKVAFKEPTVYTKKDWKKFIKGQVIGEDESIPSNDEEAETEEDSDDEDW